VTSAALALALAPGAFAAAPAAPVTEPGDLWEVTSRMSMEGMQMPAQTHKVCSPKNWTEPPGAGADEKCKTLDFKNTPTKSTWKMTCPGPPAMTGEGEITRTSPTAYTGTMKFTSEEGAMTLAISGRRVGDCDSAASRRLVAQQQTEMEGMVKQAEQTQKETMLTACTAAGNSLDFKTMQAHAVVCDQATMKSAFCKRLDSEEGFTLVCREDDPQAPTSLAEGAAYCGKDPDAIEKKFCDEALKKEDLDILGKCCPTQAQGIAQRECAGMNYTAMMGTKYQPFCVAYARNTMTDAQKTAPPEAKKKKGFKIPWPH
jgi:hypothetical protein